MLAFEFFQEVIKPRCGLKNVTLSPTQRMYAKNSLRCRNKEQKNFNWCLNKLDPLGEEKLGQKQEAMIRT